MNLKILNNPEKKIFFIIGKQGSGKTILAKVMKGLIKNFKVKILEDIQFKLSFEEKMKVYSELAEIRHAKKKILVTSHSLPMGLYDAIENDFVTWMFTSLGSFELHYLISRHILNKDFINKFEKKYQNSIMMKRKTRPYMMVTLLNHKVHYELGRYKIPKQVMAN